MTVSAPTVGRELRCPQFPNHSLHLPLWSALPFRTPLRAPLKYHLRSPCSLTGAISPRRRVHGAVRQAHAYTVARKVISSLTARFDQKTGPVSSSGGTGGPSKIPLCPPYDCSIDLLPGGPLPSSRLYNLSKPEREAMEVYIRDSLAAGGLSFHQARSPECVSSSEDQGGRRMENSLQHPISP
ncbi:uncharacterized protein LOC131969145 isoform X2 [Centropristis striata]|uniref:uncharacterized protein LOC131969145 isoform X2 n=1 Tax=Centropristis striata TaxID=184440 RepID=UPI0027DEDA88|nr:uncharacterized protein LOC131969145 isoform X2 [Centropristis striata]